MHTVFLFFIEISKSSSLRNPFESNFSTINEKKQFNSAQVSPKDHKHSSMCFFSFQQQVLSTNNRDNNMKTANCFFNILIILFSFLGLSLSMSSSKTTFRSRFDPIPLFFNEITLYLFYLQRIKRNQQYSGSVLPPGSLSSYLHIPQLLLISSMLVCYSSSISYPSAK